jgi:RecJ-like exonuclease
VKTEICQVCEGTGMCETYPPGHLADSFNGVGDPVSYEDVCNNCGGKGYVAMDEFND